MPANLSGAGTIRTVAILLAEADHGKGAKCSPRLVLLNVSAKDLEPEEDSCRNR